VNRVAVVALTLSFVVCCGTKAEVDPEIAKLPPCVMAEVKVPRDWQKASSPAGEFMFRLPPAFVESSEFAGIHGGRIWRAGDRKVHLSYGYWGLRSFPPETARCRGKISGHDVVIIDYRPKDHTFVVAWFVGSGAGRKVSHDILLDLSSPDANDRKVFDVMLESAAY
jgi:hypothetical protein